MLKTAQNLPGGAPLADLVKEKAEELFPKKNVRALLRTEPDRVVATVQGALGNVDLVEVYESLWAHWGDHVKLIGQRSRKFGGDDSHQSEKQPLRDSHRKPWFSSFLSPFDTAPRPQNTEDRILRRIQSSRAWKKLSKRERRALFALITGTRNPVSRRAREALRNIPTAPFAVLERFLVNDAHLSPKRLRNMLKDTEILGFNICIPDSSPVAEEYTHRFVEDIRFERFDDDPEGVPGKTFELQVSGHSLEVSVPDEPAIAGHCQINLDTLVEALARLPRPLLSLAKEITVFPFPQTTSKAVAEELGYEDSYTAMAVDCPNAAVDVFPKEGPDMYSVEEIVTFLIHELGHIWSERRFGAQLKKQRKCRDDWNNWAKAMKADLIRPSGYALEGGIMEDAAEAFLLYVGTLGTPEHEEYRRMMPNRFALLDKDKKCRSYWLSRRPEGVDV